MVNENLRNAGIGFGRALVTALGIFLAIAGVAFWPLSLIGIALLGFGIYQSSKDESKMKVANIVIKVIFIILGVMFLIAGLSR